MLLELLAAQPAADTAKVMVEDVAATTLYTGNGAARTITTGIDLVNPAADTLMPAGGLVWIKGRSGATGHRLFDTRRGATAMLDTTSTAAFSFLSTSLTAFGASGFDLGADASANGSGSTYAAWSFRRAARFMDIVGFWTGNGEASRQLSHRLGVTPGMVIVKGSHEAGAWNVSHRSLSGNLVLNSTAAAVGTPVVTAVSDTTFTVSSSANAAGFTYIAYVFAHDDTADGIIQCGSFTTDASGNATVNLGWEPGWGLTKYSSVGGNWTMLDEARGWTVDSPYRAIGAESSGAEVVAGAAYYRKTATGFTSNGNSPNVTVIYCCIRRGPMRVPTTGTSVFTVTAGTAAVSSVAPADMHLARFDRTTTANTHVADRLRGYGATSSPTLQTNLTAAEASPTTAPYVTRTETGASGPTVDLRLGAGANAFVHYAFKRAPGFFDTVAYTGRYASGTRINHNLGQAPSMMWIKARNEGTIGWWVYHKALGAGATIMLSNAFASQATTNFFDQTEPNEAYFTLGQNTNVNNNIHNYVAYLFGDVPGVSKAGFYAGSASAVTVDCGFSPRFVLIKRTDTAADWYVFDTARGIVAAADPTLTLNSTAAENTGLDVIDPVSGGFQVASSVLNGVNAAGGSFCFYAVA